MTRLQHKLQVGGWLILAVGTLIVAQSAGWLTAIGVTIMLWGNNTERASKG